MQLGQDHVQVLADALLEKGNHLIILRRGQMLVVNLRPEDVSRLLDLVEVEAAGV